MNKRWVYVASSGEPTQPGWYATLHSWDPEEGAFPRAHYWDGSRWIDNIPGYDRIFAYIPELFSDQETAEKCADENDPD